MILLILSQFPCGMSVTHEGLYLGFLHGCLWICGKFYEDLVWLKFSMLVKAM